MKTLITGLTALTLSAGIACAASTTTPPNDSQGSQTTAQSNDTTSGQSNDQASARPSAKLTQQLRDNLTSAGFTDIKIMPESFLIRAKDKNGNPMMMVVNPDSMMEIRAVDTNSAKGAPNGSSTDSSNNASDANPSASGASPNTQK